jgi:hypothetical protein
MRQTGEYHQSKAELRIMELLRLSDLTARDIQFITGIWFIYQRLARLESRGLISSFWADGPYPRRRFYRRRI